MFRYIASFAELVASPLPNTDETEAGFTMLISAILERHAPTLVNMSAGVAELRDSVTVNNVVPARVEDTVSPFLDRYVRV